jgi:cobalt-zinc-cadmium efflux system membrane fusion protein
VLSVRREHVGRLAIGQQVRFRADGIADVLASRISWISTEVDEKTRTIMARAEFENPTIAAAADITAGQRLLRANMFGTAEINVLTRTRAVVVPREAVQWCNNDVPVVFVATDGGTCFEPRRVKTGVSRGKITEIVDGLAAGEPIVSAGSFMLKAELLRRHE